MEKYALSSTIALLYATFNVSAIRKIFRVDRVQQKCQNMSPLEGSQIDLDYQSCVVAKHEQLNTLDKRIFMCDLLLGIIGIVLGSLIKKNNEVIGNGLIGGGFIIVLYTLINNQNQIRDIYRIVTLFFALGVTIYVSMN